MGTAIGKVILGPTTSPGRPGNLVLIKATSSSLTVGWQQAFNGGPPQTFIVSEFRHSRRKCVPSLFLKPTFKLKV